MLRIVWDARSTVQGCGAMIRARWQAPPLIVDARLSPTNLCSSLRTVSDGVARRGNRDGWSARARKQATVPPRQLPMLARLELKLVRPGPNDRRGQVESLGRNRLTSDAPYKACCPVYHPCPASLSWPNSTAGWCRPTAECWRF